MPKGLVGTKRQERLWAKATKLAAAAGKAGDYAYITGIYKKMVNKSGPFSALIKGGLR